MSAKTKSGYELAEKLNPSIGTTSAIIETCGLICRHARTYARLQEQDCNVGLTDNERIREEGLQKRIADLCSRLPLVDGKPIRPVFSGDPRGATIKLAIPDGRSDDWGAVGICVPNS